MEAGAGRRFRRLHGCQLQPYQVTLKRVGELSSLHNDGGLGTRSKRRKGCWQLQVVAAVTRHQNR